MMKTYLRSSIFLATIIVLFACNRSVRTGEEKSSLDKPEVVATTTMIADLLREIGGEHISLKGLMGPGIDPPLYKATESDVSKLFEADMIFYNGLHLEGKMGEIFAKMEKQDQKTFAVTDAIPKTALIALGENRYDPHVWFSIENWKRVARFTANALILNDPANEDSYSNNLKKYLSELDSLASDIDKLIRSVSPDNRVLITAHDAFEYFGKEFGFEVIGLHCISTVSEAGVADVRELAVLIAERRIPAIFIESSVPRRNIEALQEAVRSRGFDVKIGGELYSDALGSAESEAGTYIGMFRHNVYTITEALK